jgi:hypothetical protein
LYSDLDWSQLRKVARDSLTALETKLTASWHKYLKLNLLAEMVADDVDEPLQERQMKELNEILSNFTATLNSPNMAYVTNAAGFRELYDALGELSLTAEQRKRRQLLAAKLQLDQDLSRVNAPASWRNYLNLPIAAEGDETSGIPPAPNMSESHVTLLNAALRRYDQTALDEQFRKIAELAGFQSTRLRLREYLDLIQDAPAATVPRPIEQLPLPLPVPAPVPAPVPIPISEATDVLVPVPE